MEFVTNENAVDYIQGLKKTKPKSFKSLYPDANPLAIDLLEKMLVFNPDKRISVEEALQHPYLRDLVEDLANHKVACQETFNFDFEKESSTKESLKRLLAEEICHYRPDSSLAKQLSKLDKEEAKQN